MATLGKIYILHGWAYSTTGWAPFVLGLTALGYEVELLKIPGLTATIAQAWKIEDYVAWLKDAIVEKNEKVIFLGHSNGGRISIAFAAAFPERVRGMILIDSAGVYHTDIKTRVKRALYGSLAHAGKLFTQSKKLRDLFYSVIGEHDYNDATPVMRETMNNLIAIDQVPMLSHILVPVLLIWGEEDQVTPLSDGKIMQAEFPHAVLKVVSGARHSPQFTHEADVLSIIQQYSDEKYF